MMKKARLSNNLTDANMIFLYLQTLQKNMVL